VGADVFGANARSAPCCSGEGTAEALAAEQIRAVSQLCRVHTPNADPPIMGTPAWFIFYKVYSTVYWCRDPRCTAAAAPRNIYLLN
jgi:hypothetical protein